MLQVSSTTATRPRWHSLILLFSTAVLAAPQSAKQTLPSELGSRVPSCAQSCVASFIAEQMPRCAPSNSILCLCTTQTSSGYTLGERALQCVAGACDPTTAHDIQGQMYHLCDRQPGAISATHAVLTATSSSGPTATKAGSVATNDIGAQDAGTSDRPTSTSKSDLSNSLPRTTSQSTLLSAESSVPSSTSTADLSGAQQASPSSTSQPSGSLTKGQVIGITGGGLATVLAVVGVLFLVLSRRRRRNMHEQPVFRGPEREMKRGSMLVIEGPVHASTRDPLGRLGPTLPANPRSHKTKEKRVSLWRRSFKPDEVGAALSPPLKSGKTDPASNYRASKLLPDKPDIYNVVAAPQPLFSTDWGHARAQSEDRRKLRASRSSSCGTAMTWETEVPEPANPNGANRLEYAPQMSTSPKLVMMPPPPVRQHPASLMPHNPYASRVQQPYDHYSQYPRGRYSVTSDESRGSFGRGYEAEDQQRLWKTGGRI